MSSRLSSFTNPKVKHACRLREGGYRRQQGQFVVDGAREVARAVASGIELLEVFVREDQFDAHEEILRSVERRAGVWQVPRPLFEKLSFGDRHAGLVAIARTPEHTLDGLSLPPEPLVAVLERLEKPGNVGAVLRSADAAGVSAVIVCDPATDLFNPNTIRASAGAVFTVPTATTTAAELPEWLAARSIRAYVARVDAETTYTQADWRGPAALVLGSEDRGASRQWNPPLATAIRLPMLGVVDSLNVSVAAAVIFYEALRQRGTGG